MRMILYVDMDNVLVDFPSALPQFSEATIAEYKGRLSEIPGIFSKMAPLPQAIDAFNELASAFDTYILSTATWENPSSWSDKLLWVQRHLGGKAYKRLILSHHKNLNHGDFLIDDRTNNGAGGFVGEHILFGSELFPDWASVLSYLRSRST
jgi:5'-nucleotidase